MLVFSRNVSRRGRESASYDSLCLGLYSIPMHSGPTKAFTDCFTRVCRLQLVWNFPETVSFLPPAHVLQSPGKKSSVNSRHSIESFA